MSKANTSNTPTGVGRRRRWALAVVTLTLLVISGALLVASRPWFIMAVIQPELERMLGGEVEINHAHWSGIGTMELTGVSVRVPNHESLPEPAGEVASIGHATIDVNILPLVIGRLSLRALSFDGVVLRLAEDAQNAGQFTFLDLDPRIDLKVRRGKRPPHIAMRNVTLESGEFDDQRYNVIGRRRVAGSMEPMSGDDSTFAFTLAEIDGGGQVIEGGLYIHGRWDTVTLAHAARIDGLTLDERTLAMCPQIVRLWWDHMDLSGRVSEAKVDWTIGDTFTVELVIEEVELTLPDQVEALLVRYHNGHILEQTDRPRMELHSGVIRWQDDGIELIDLEGRILSGDMGEDELVHLPYLISVSIDELPATGFDRRGDWLTHAIAIAPFRMHIETSMDVTHRDREDESAPSRSRAVDLPLPVARVLEQLQLADWSIDTSIEISREPASVLDDGSLVAAPIQWRGELNINNGSLRIEQFDYPLREVNAALRIEQNVIFVEEFHARGMKDSRFTVDGRIILPPEAPAAAGEMGFDVNVIAVHLPLDETFLAALPQHNRGFFDSLFARPLYESFERAGLVGLAAEPDDLNERLAHIERLLVEHAAQHDGNADADDPADPALIRERDRLIAQLERGPITLAGNVHLDLRIRREVGPDHRDVLTGTIEPDAVGVVFEHFPYPFTIISGMLQWSPDRISIVSNEQTNGLSIILPGGGRGTITGWLDRPFVDGVRKIHPDLRFEVENEPMNELLAAAIPLTPHDIEHLPDADQWPGEVLAAPARLLQSIGLEGTLRTSGRIQTILESGGQQNDEARATGSAGDVRRSSHVKYHFDAHLHHGSATPNRQLAEYIGAAGLFWPDGFAVHNVQGHLTVSEKRIDLRGFHGWHDPGEILATGLIDRSTDPTTIELQVTLSDLDLHESIINLVPRNGLDMARELWDRYQPHGGFTADIVFRETGDFRHPIKLIAAPTVCHVQIDGEPVSFTHREGKIALQGGDDPVVNFEQLHLNVHHGVIDHGDLVINGAYGITDDDNPLHVTGQWTNAAIESPIITEMLRLIGAERHQQWFADHSPRGRVDAAFEYQSARGVHPPEAADYWMSITPRNLAFVLNETPIAAEFDPRSNVMLSPGHLQFNSFAGRVGESTFRVHGDVLLDGAIDASLDVDFNGRVASDEVMALFPSPARNVLRQLEFDDGRLTKVHQSRLELYGTPASISGDDHSPPEYDWDVAYHGRLFVNGASMQIGVPATEIDGSLDLTLRVLPDAPPQLTMSAAFDSLRVIDRLITDVRADEIRLSEDGTAVLIPEIRGQSYGGMVLAEATVGVGEHDRYELQVELAGLALGELYADHAERLAATNGGNRAGRPRTPRGEVFGGVKLDGQHGRPETRSGRGTIRAVGGNLENIPMVLQVFHVLQMTIPLRGSLDQANAEFYVDGDHVIFETILFESTVAEQFAVFQLLGHGRMNLNTFELNTRFRSRGGMLLVRDLAGGLGDQLYVIEVTGTPADPKARVLPLPWLFQPFTRPTGLGAAPTEP